jgi:hypothetical protein
MGSTKKAKSTKPPREAAPSETAATRPPSAGTDPFNDVLLQLGEATSILAVAFCAMQELEDPHRPEEPACAYEDINLVLEVGLDVLREAREALDRAALNRRLGS